MVAHENGKYHLWYCGSRGTVAERVFRLGLAVGRDGRTFPERSREAVFEFGDGEHSILTPTLLRNPDGSVLREDGKLRMWFSSTWFDAPTKIRGRHTLHETTGENGTDWAKPSPALMEGVYAPSILKIGDTYWMWYTDVSGNPWVIRHVSSDDGKSWKPTKGAVIKLDQKWESGRLFYPHVIQIGDVFLMWYGSYRAQQRNTTALGFAASTDGVTWHKHPANPVFTPDPKRAWESHYVTSQCVLRLKDGSLRMWYASRKKPPFVNKYFAISTAVWKRD